MGILGNYGKVLRCFSNFPKIKLPKIPLDAPPVSVSWALGNYFWNRFKTNGVTGPNAVGEILHRALFWPLFAYNCSMRPVFSKFYFDTIFWAWCHNGAKESGTSETHKRLATGFPNGLTTVSKSSFPNNLNPPLITWPVSLIINDSIIKFHTLFCNKHQNFS